MTATTLAPFTAAGWLQMSHEEQRDLVRPFYGEYKARRAELDRAGRYAYNADFKGHLPSLNPATTGTTDKDEDTAIYLLQTLHTWTLEQEKLAAFIARGARPLAAEDVDPAAPAPRGTVAVIGRYSGGATGYHVYEDVRIVRTGFRGHRLAGIPKGRRTNGYDLSDGTALYFLPADGRPNTTKEN
ncbi:hypothetical protein BKA24_001770 [Microbacterium marinum]|uniref:Uncharacterized protein n=1 Tax=Microbacterium marinum TaxID=421115 RepID=A0A7W7BQP0_9MICO|nr:hypothetical protein [Microbacterium marinum]MBB4667061.1 hypothetical protein [Microbacterium marinum]